jgi:hypothetical protein
MNRASPALRAGLLLALGMVLLAASPAQAIWQVEQLEYVLGGLNVPPAIAMDAQDRVHIAWGTGEVAQLEHVRAFSAGGFPIWDRSRYTGVSTAGVAPGQAYIAAAGDGAYVAYRPYTRTPTVIPAAYFTGTTWQPYTVPQTSKASVYGLVTDNAGKPYWLINTEGTTDGLLGVGVGAAGLYLASKNGTLNTGVKVSAFPASQYLRQGSTLNAAPDAVIRQGGQAILDAQGNVQALQYYEISNSGYMLYGKGSTGGPFTTDGTADPTWQDRTGRPSIDVDTAGNPHIAYTQTWPTYGVRYSTWTGSHWEGDWIEQGGSDTGLIGTFPQVLVGDDGVPHVIYADLMHGLLKHAFKEDGTWQIETVDAIGTQATGGLLSGSMAAAMDSRGGIGVAYYDGANWLKYAYLVPEPGTLLLALAAGAMALRRTRRKV